MEPDISNRMAIPAKRGRPTLIEQAQRDAVPLPEPVRDPVPMFRCRCGHLFAPRVYRTMSDGVRVMRCDHCGYQHRIPQELLSKLF